MPDVSASNSTTMLTSSLDSELELLPWPHLRDITWVVEADTRTREEQEKEGCGKGKCKKRKRRFTAAVRCAADLISALVNSCQCKHTFQHVSVCCSFSPFFFLTCIFLLISSTIFIFD